MGCCGSCGGEAPNHMQVDTPEKNDIPAQNKATNDDNSKDDSSKDNSSQSNEDKAQDKENIE